MAILVVLLRRIGWASMGDALLSIGWRGALPIMLFGFAENFLDSVALRFAVGPHIGLFRVLVTNSAGALVNMLLPWEMGEVAKGALLRGSAQGVSGVIIWNYLFKLSRPIVGVAAALLGLALGSGIDAHMVTIIIAANAVAFLPYVFLKLLVRQRFFFFVARLLGILRFFRVSRRRDEIMAKAALLHDEVRRFWHERPAAYFGLLGAQAGARAASWLALYAITTSLHLDYSFGRVAMIYAAFNVAEFVTAVIPARIGVSEGAAFGLFTLFGFPPDAAVLIYVVTRLKALASNGLLVPFVWMKRA